MFKNFKRISAILILFICVMIPLSSIAQIPTQRTSIEKHIKILKSKLKLNNEQLKKIKYVLEDQREELGIAMNANRSNSQALDEAIQEITKNTDDKIKTILTVKQIEAYDKIIEEREAKANKQKEDGNN